ncbi:hypothetical protein NPIL_463501 [Nephila pilipes]|uniref:Uncharacterized protein n=1 Tax=Nephila pilipes TaxID=299642 RepID=A0A8X6QK91_NEPPI|nr:hypothetical protein NPIL_463501 [Nephila pilipes]
MFSNVIVRSDYVGVRGRPGASVARRIHHHIIASQISSAVPSYDTRCPVVHSYTFPPVLPPSPFPSHRRTYFRKIRKASASPDPSTDKEASTVGFPVLGRGEDPLRRFLPPFLVF